MSLDMFQERQTQWLDELGDDKKVMLLFQAVRIYSAQNEQKKNVTDRHVQWSSQIKLTPIQSKANVTNTQITEMFNMYPVQSGVH